MNYSRALILTTLIAFPAVLRMIDHPWNLAPLGALSLFCGACLRDKKWAFFVPLVAMALSDVALGMYRDNMSFYTFHATAPFVYLSYAISVLLGMLVRRDWNSLNRTRPADTESEPGTLAPAPGGEGLNLRRTCSLGAATLAGAIQFFFVTNFGDWLLFDSYPKTAAGLYQCYVAGLPFFRATLVGDVFYVVVLFAGLELMKERVAAFKRSGLLHAGR